MLPVAAKLRLPNIVNYHVPDVFASTVLRQKVLSERRCGDFGEVFVLGNGEHLVFGQAAEGDAILERNQSSPTIGGTITLQPLQRATDN
jgi:hypothetical protein